MESINRITCIDILVSQIVRVLTPSSLWVQRMRALIPQRRLARGAFGSVSLVTCGRTGEHFALKSVDYPTERSDRDREARKRVKVEAKVGIRVANKNRYLLPCRAAWRDDAKAYILSVS